MERVIEELRQANRHLEWIKIDVMLIFFLLAFVIYLLIGHPSVAKAETVDHTPKYSLAVGEGWAFTWKSDGSSAKFGASTFRLMAGVSVPIAEGISWGTSVGVLLPHTEFKPVPRIAFGPNFKVTDLFAVGVGVLYQISPPYHGKPIEHCVTIGVTPVVKVVDWLSLGLGINIGRLFVSNVWVGVIQPQATFTIPTRRK